MVQTGALIPVQLITQVLRPPDDILLFLPACRVAASSLRRELLERLLRGHDAALRILAQLHLAGEQRGAPLGKPSLRQAHLTGREQVRLVGGYRRRLPQLPPHIPLGLLDQRAGLEAQPHHHVHRLHGRGGSCVRPQERSEGACGEEEGEDG